MSETAAQVMIVANNLTADAFHRVLDFAIKGYGKLPGVRTAARNTLARKQDPEAALDALINQHIAMAGGQGFATNWGGFIVSIVTVPANLTAATFVQARIVALVAHLRGYELDDPRIRTAILMVMLGPTASRELIGSHMLPSTPQAVATAPVFDDRLDQQVTKALRDRTMSQLGGKRFGVFVGKRIPLIGGGVGAAVDGWSTRSVAKHALAEFPSRRPKLASFKSAN